MQHKAMHDAHHVTLDPFQEFSVFPTEGFLRPGMQVRRFGRKLNALDDFLCEILMPIFKKFGFQPP